MPISYSQNVASYACDCVIADESVLEVQKRVIASRKLLDSPSEETVGNQRLNFILVEHYFVLLSDQQGQVDLEIPFFFRQ